MTHRCEHARVNMLPHVATKLPGAVLPGTLATEVEEALVARCHSMFRGSQCPGPSIRDLSRHKSVFQAAEPPRWQFTLDLIPLELSKSKQRQKLDGQPKRCRMTPKAQTITN